MVNKKNDLTGHLRNHHEDHVGIEHLNVEALSNPHANVHTNKLVCEGKDESGVKVDTAESRVKVDIEVNTSFRKRKSPHSDSEECISNLKWDNCSKQFSSISTVGLEQLMLTGEIRQTENTIGELKEKVSEYCGKYISSEEKITCISLKLKKEVNIERIKQVLKEFSERNDEIPEQLLKAVSSEFIGQGG